MQALQPSRKEIIGFFMKRGVLLSQEMLLQLQEGELFEELKKQAQSIPHEVTVLNPAIKALLQSASTSDYNWQEIDKAKTITEKTNGHFEKTISVLLDNKPIPQDIAQNQPNVPIKILYSYNLDAQKREAQDFVDYFTQRYNALSSILRHRIELQGAVSISRLAMKREKESVSIIGMVTDKQVTKNNNHMITVEDPTGSINVMISKNRQDLYDQAKDIVYDEVIGIAGISGDKIVFGTSLYFPDIPALTELKKSPDETYAMFLSDLHVGSNYFLEEDFERFLRWINGETGSDEQKRIAEKIKYIFIIGDLVDGCGVYPEQDKELAIKDIKDQYAECARLLARIPPDKFLIICPGNHDAMRVAEPQLPIYHDFAEPLYQLKNATFVSNPALINIHSSSTFSGFDVLMYHGYSFDYYVAEVESIRNKGGYDRADLIMKFLLQKRHLAPSHSSTLYVPETTHDPHVISRVPDFFISGHIHKSAAANYRNVTLISGSCWQAKTAFQEKIGHHPEPSRVPIVNLQTRSIKIIKFGNEAA